MRIQKSKSKSVERHHSLEKQQQKREAIFQKLIGTNTPQKHLPILLGVCAMKKKIQAKPMQQILKRITNKQIQIVIINDKYWNIQITEWPKVHALICFYSDGFPYLKAWKYVQLTKPFLINDLDKQQILWDRTFVYNELRKHNIPTSKHYFVCRKQQSILQFYKARNSDFGSQCQEFYKSSIQLLLQEIDQKQVQNSENRKSIQDSFKKKRTIEYQNHNVDNQSRKSATQTDTQKKKIERKLSTEYLIRNPINAIKQYFLKPIYEQYQIVQKDDCILIGSHKLKKPFVEKPFDAENHQVCIYYPEADGGGRKILFRKKENCSSCYQPNINNIRTEGNYLYEQFQRTDGFDIKVYTVGPYYMHAQARKAPSLDGVVQRNQSGKQKRYPIVLTPEQKLIAQKIVQVFGQYVCGFDLLRSNGKSYVCDVNGWSFVKGNNKYYDDCAIILKKIIIQHFYPNREKQNQGKFEFVNFMNYIPNQFKPPTEDVKQNTEQLRSVVAIFRHGDRNPKQKMKLFVNDYRFLQFFSSTGKQVKMKDPKSLTKLLNITNAILAEIKFDITQNFLKLVQLKSVLQIGGHFQGLNRKIQIKAIDKQIDKQNPDKVIVKSALLILKWGGQLTKQGQNDAKQLGKFFRLTKYPYEQGLISLHSSYKHDLKTYSSQEGRCIKTGAAFLQGFLDLQGDLAPIINSMINRQAKAQLLLDYGKQEYEKFTIFISKQKQILQSTLNSYEPLYQNLSKYFDVNKFQPKMIQIIHQLTNPKAKLQTLLKQIKELTSAIAQKVSLEQTSYYINSQDVPNTANIGNTHHQSLSLMYKRWYKLQKDLYNFKKDSFNISKIPDIYDSINYDLNHNKEILQSVYSQYQSLFATAQILAYFVVPNEYGIQNKTKLETARSIVAPLCRKIFKDLMFWKGQKGENQQQYWKYTKQDNKQWRHIRTRLYFTSSSHIYSIFHILTLGNRGELLDSCERDISEQVRNITYIGYLAHIDLRLYQNLSAKENDPKRFRLQLSFSPKFDIRNETQNKKLMLGHSQFTIQEIQTFFKTVLGESWLKYQ